MDPRRAKDRKDLRAARIFQLALIPVVLGVLWARFFRNGISNSETIALGVLLVVGLALVFANAYAFKRALRRLGSREALSEHISSIHRLRRMKWIWVEYVIARNTARESYQGEPPVDFLLEANALAQVLGQRTRAYERTLITVMSIVAVVSTGFTLWLEIAYLGKRDYTLVLIVLVICVVLGAYSIWIARGTRADRELARRIESARLLPNGERWQTLVSIAHEEFEDGPHT